MKHRLVPIVALALGVFAVLIFVGVTTFNATLERIVIEQAERTSIAWAGYIGNRMNRIEDIAKGAPLSGEERQFLNGVRGFGDIFRFKLFDTKGRIRLISDDLHTDLADNPTVGEDNWKALSVVETGEPYSELEDGRLKPDRPDIYVETYVPVWRNEHMVAVAEVYMDRTSETAALRADFLTFGWRAAGLAILALSLPAPEPRSQYRTQPRARGGAGQGPVPRPYEPRVPHALEFDPGADPGSAARRPGPAG